MTLKAPIKYTVLRESTKSTLYFGGARIPLFSYRDIVLGERKLVIIIEDWGVLEEYAGEKLGFYQLLANDEKIEYEFDWKMLTQDILETAKISQLSWGTFEKEKKEGFAGDISMLVGIQSLENSAFRYSSCSP